MPKTISEMSSQEIFDFVAKTLIQQRKPSFVVTRPDSFYPLQCKYRGPDGVKCAAGHLIPDDEYKVTIEGVAVENVPYVIQQTGSEVVKLQLISSLQSSHDTCATAFHKKEQSEETYLEELIKSLRSVAERYNLDTTSIDNL